MASANPIPKTPSSRKRCLDDALSSPFSKMRSTLQLLRPLFLQVMGAPESLDVQQSEAARAIEEKMKLMVDLCKQMAMEEGSLKKCDNGALTNKNQDVHSEKPSESLLQPLGVEECVKLCKEDGLGLGSSIVGGSAFGWNFITFSSSKAEYYGRSKESFRAAKSKLEAGKALS